MPESRARWIPLFALASMASAEGWAQDAGAGAAKPEAPTLRSGEQGEAGERFEGLRYSGTFVHGGGETCESCHLELPDHPTAEARAAVVSTRCAACHTGLPSWRHMRPTHPDDHDGDGDSTEPLAEELEGLLALLEERIRATSEAVAHPICYHPTRYPHWFDDQDGDGSCDVDEASPSNSYGVWSIPLLRASANYQAVEQDRGAWAHNFDYAAQLLIDSIAVLGGDTTGLARPVPSPEP
jgi:hypothetical protein